MDAQDLGGPSGAFLRIQLAEDFDEKRTVIKVVGVGGAGCNAINRMVEAGLAGTELIAANSDAQVLRKCQAHVNIQLGEQSTRGLGVGGDSSKGRQAALESEGQLREVLQGADMVFVTTGMGGGTGTGGGPVVARLAKELGALTVGIVTRPFEFEGLRRASIAEQGIQEMRQSVDTLLVIPNQRLFDVIDPDTNHDQAFRVADDVLRKSVQSISDLITVPGLINLDMNDLRAVMKDAGEALIGIGEASGPGRAMSAAREAMSSPLLENVVIDGAKGLIVNIAGRQATLKTSEIEEIVATIQGTASPEVNFKMGNVYNESLGDSIRVTVIATGFPSKRSRMAFRPAGGRQLPGARPAPLSEEPSDAQLLKSLNETDRWTKPAYLRMKVRKLR
ncbi:MAG: cell division protein FtsZ [Elusimicrobiota bacterium]|nr:MAG: cell division protein FtsZ [Elusimicrobiota bacterium]